MHSVTHRSRSPWTHHDFLFFPIASLVLVGRSLSLVAFLLLLNLVAPLVFWFSWLSLFFWRWTDINPEMRLSARPQGPRPFFLISPVSLWHKEVSFEQRGTTLTKISGEKEVTVNHAGCVQLDRFRNKENVLQMFPFTRVSVALLYCLHIRKHGVYTRETPGLYLLSTMRKRRKTFT